MHRLRESQGQNSEEGWHVWGEEKDDRKEREN